MHSCAVCTTVSDGLTEKGDFGQLHSPLVVSDSGGAIHSAVDHATDVYRKTHNKDQCSINVAGNGGSTALDSVDHTMSNTQSEITAGHDPGNGARHCLHCVRQKHHNSRRGSLKLQVALVLTALLSVVLLLAFLLYCYHASCCPIYSQKTTITVAAPASAESLRLSDGWEGDMSHSVDSLSTLMKRDHQRVFPQTATELGMQSRTQMHAVNEDAAFRASVFEHVKQRFQNVLGSSPPPSSKLLSATPQLLLHDRSTQQPQQEPQWGHWLQLVEEEMAAWVLEQQARDASPAVTMSLPLLLQGRLSNDSMVGDHNIDVEYGDEDIAGHVERYMVYNRGEGNVDDEGLPHSADDPYAALSELAADWKAFNLAEVLTAPPLDVNMKQRRVGEIEVDDEDFYVESAGEWLAANGSSTYYYDIGD